MSCRAERVSLTGGSQEETAIAVFVLIQYRIVGSWELGFKVQGSGFRVQGVLNRIAHCYKVLSAAITRLIKAATFVHPRRHLPGWT